MSRLPRLRLQLTGWAHRTLILAEAPRPNCPDCGGGDGGQEYDWGDGDTGEYAGTDWDPCPCWNEARRWVLLRLPRRTPPGGYSNEPPF